MSYRSPPVLFIIFNRPDTTKQVFQAIKEARPERLYVAADGPRADRAGEAGKCDEVRRIATEVDWDCEVRTLFREENLGCKAAVSSALDWLFENEEYGIILEDDCLPSQDFFTYCGELLDRYVDDERVWTIAGTNNQNGIKRGDASYFFSQYVLVWGWATWKRAWALNDLQMSFWDTWKKSESWHRIWDNDSDRIFWESRFDEAAGNRIDTWDYAWIASVWNGGGLTAVPNYNLISNIGFGVDATHTMDKDSHKANIPLTRIDELSHPPDVVINREADRYAATHFFSSPKWSLIVRFVRLAKRIIRRIVTLR